MLVDARKVVEKFAFGAFLVFAHPKKSEQKTVFGRVGAPYQLFQFCGFVGLADFGAGSKIAKRFVSAGFAPRGVWALASLVGKN